MCCRCAVVDKLPHLGRLGGDLSGFPPAKRAGYCERGLESLVLRDATLITAARKFTSIGGVAVFVIELGVHPLWALRGKAWYEIECDLDYPTNQIARVRCTPSSSGDSSYLPHGYAILQVIKGLLIGTACDE